MTVTWSACSGLQPLGDARPKPKPALDPDDETPLRAGFLLGKDLPQPGRSRPLQFDNAEATIVH